MVGHSSTMLFLFFTNVIIFIGSVAGFVIGGGLRQEQNRVAPNLYGISEWRDMVFDFPGTGDDRRLGLESGAPPKEICILPFPFQEVLLQGETKQLRLYEERFLKLFEESTRNHGGVVAMGMIADKGIIQTVSIAEIEDFNRVEGFGIFVSIRVVSRATLLDVTQQEPFIKGVCTEITDSIPPNLELPNLVASEIERFVVLLSSIEDQLEHVENESGGSNSLDDNDITMQQRLKIAQLDDKFYDENADDDDDEEEIRIDRRRRFQYAYNLALSSDMQGYQGAEKRTGDRSPQELTAISWAAFCTEILPELDGTTRIQALDCANLFERLKLASGLLRRKKKFLMAKLEKAGLDLPSEDRDEGNDKLI